MKKTVLIAVATLGGLVGGTLHIAHAATYQPINWTEAADLTTLDSAQANDSVSTEILTQAGQGLYRYGKNHQPEFADAQSVQVSDDGLTYTFTLKPHLHWSNGAPVTAHDYVFGMQQTVDPKNKANGASMATDIQNAAAVTDGTKPVTALGVQALDDRTLVIKLHDPMPALPSLLTVTCFFPQNQAFVEKQQGQYGTNAQKTISNGPFVVKNWNGSSTAYELDKNQQYVDKAQVKTSKITVQTMTDTTTGYNLYQTKKVDYTPLSAMQVKASQHKTDYQTIKTGTTDFLALNTTQKALQNQALRVAMRQAINMKSLAKEVLVGTERQGRSFTPDGVMMNPTTKADFTRDAQLTSPTNQFNPKAAKQNFKKAQQVLHKNTIQLTLLSDNGTQSRNEAQYIQNQLETHLPGLKVTIKAEPKAARIKAQLAHEFDMVLTSWGGEDADATSFLDMFKADSGLNIVKFNNATYDRALNKAATVDAMNPKNRYQDLVQADKTLQQQAPIITLGYKSVPALIRQNIKGLTVNTVGVTFDFKTAYKR